MTEKGLQEQKKSSSMLVQAHASEEQAAMGFWECHGKIILKNAAGSWREAALEAGESLRA